MSLKLLLVFLTSFLYINAQIEFPVHRNGDLVFPVTKSFTNDFYSSHYGNHFFDFFTGEFPIVESSSGVSLLREFKLHKDYVVALSFYPNDNLLATASKDGTVKIIDVETGSILNTLNHSGEVWDVSFDFSGSTLLTVSDDNKINLWDVPKGKLKFSLEGHDQTIFNARFNAQGSKVISSSADGSAKVWDLNKKKCICSLKHNLKANMVFSSVFHPKKDYWVCTSSMDGVIRAWDVLELDEPKLIKSFNVGDNETIFPSVIYSLEFDSKGEKLLSCASDETTSMWDFNRGELIYTVTGHDGAVWTSVFDSSGKNFVTASWDGCAKVWDVSLGKEIYTVGGHSGSVTSALFDLEGKRLFTSSWDETIKCWSLSS
ncbi:WD40 repeat domain-containing protein [Candidatus Babeliales bacterium]|nr:WD40 repeat domain-containing protein [Candidatus Babeliales bacterium]